MTKWILAAGAAALAIVTPALAEKGGNQGDKGKGGQSAKAERGGGGGGKADSSKSGGGDRAMKSERQSERRFVQRDDRGKGGKQQARSDRGERRADRVVVRDFHRNQDLNRDSNRFVPRWNEHGLVRGFHNGCPPGLAKKNNGCLPPGQAKKVGSLFPAALSRNMLDGAYRQWYRDDNDFYYRNDGDHIYRVRREGGLIDALFPSFDRDYYYYPVGMNYPSDYNYYNVPYQYSSYYPDNGNYSYRYGDGAIYQVNRSSGLIQGISALLAGDLSVGQRMPSNYGAYNLPMSYRDRYYDTGQDMYRYNDGYIYRADPTTQLITAVISALV
ncbi:MAG: hypothetical protein ABIP07_03595 [Sphingomicrobium sp.]